MPSSTGETITVHVRLHSILRKPPMGNGPPRSHVALTLPRGSTVRDVLSALDTPELDIIFSLNEQVVGEGAVLQQGDQLALIPAVAGGTAPVKWPCGSN